MAKKSYRWRYSLDASRLDVCISIKSDNGIGMQSVPIRVVVAVLASVLACFWITQVSPLSKMGIGWTVAFVIFWLVASIVLLKPDKSGHLAFEQLPILVNYLPKVSRYIPTRSTSPAWGALQVIGIEDIDPDRGIIHFSDGAVGLMYRVTGSASLLLFDKDRDAIIDRVDAFWRNMNCDYETTFITLREPQKVDKQIQAMDRRIANMGDDPDLAELRELAIYERDLLEQRIGADYKSLHQYMLIRARSMEALEAAHGAITHEIESSRLMFKRVQAVYDTDEHGNLTWELTDVFRTIFGSLDADGHVGAMASASDFAKKGGVNYGSSR